MKEQLDLVQILKDCPRGMELDCTMYENVTFVEVCKDTNTLYPIYCITTDENGNRSGCSFTKNGYASPRNSAKCVIFPKGRTSWEGFQKPFVDGDIVFYNDTVAIFKEWGDETLFRTYVAKGLNCEDLIGINTPLFGKSVRNEIRFATEEEKQILFKALEENRYQWNPETKTLEKLIVPKFKVGNKIKHKDTVLTIITVRTDSYIIEDDPGNFGILMVSQQDNWELVPNKTTKDMEENKINQMSLANCDLDEVEIVLGDRFELKIKDGKYYAVRKKPIYPKTYEECCKVLGIDGYPITLINVTDEEEKLFMNFIRLKRCRDAYWKIAGEQMGLGKPWKPVWDESEDLYTIHTFNGEIRLSGTAHRNAILVFPTEEMRDAFFENFKDLIESCKELL